MALKLYRRHRKECEAGLPEDSKSGEFEEGGRGWKRCGCPVHVSDTLGRRFKRQSTGRWEWGGAREIVAKWQSAGLWEIPSEAPLPQPVVAPAELGVHTTGVRIQFPHEGAVLGKSRPSNASVLALLLWSAVLSV
jgi:hypothetical protein